MPSTQNELLKYKEFRVLEEVGVGGCEDVIIISPFKYGGENLNTQMLKQMKFNYT